MRNHSHIENRGDELTHHKEIAGQRILIQIIVGQVQHLEHGECTETTRQWAQTIDRYIENAKFRHRR